MLVFVKTFKTLTLRCTYYFTEYTFEKIVTIDPNIDAIICTTPYSGYSEEAKKLCIQKGIGLFMLAEFMGAIRFEGDKYLNFLWSRDKAVRVQHFSDELRKSQLLNGRCSIYLIGSYLRNKIYDDIDIILVYKDELPTHNIDELIREVKTRFKHLDTKLDITVCSENEFLKLHLVHDNKEKVL